MGKDETLVYTHDGDSYRGHLKSRPISKWQDYGIEHRMKYLYKGYRYYQNKKESVCVFTNRKWGVGELAKRKANGFLGIREYYC